MNMIQANAIVQQQQKIEANSNCNESPSQQQNSSPVRSSSIFGAITRPKTSIHEVMPHDDNGTNFQNGFTGSSKKYKIKIPTSIEDVPFRRQDRRILNARRKRNIDRSLIRFVVSCGTLLVVLGSSLLIMWYFIKVKWTDPFLIIGPVILACGILVCLFSVEICIRLHNANKKVLDPEIDHLTNLHQIKHWINPELIPFGWGQYTSQSIDFSDDETLHYDGGTMSTTDTIDNNLTDEANLDSPHHAMAFEMRELGATSTSPEIPNDIFDESLRYSAINRPRLIIERTDSPPVGRQQIRGDFITEEERIANLFTPKINRIIVRSKK